MVMGIGAKSFSSERPLLGGTLRVTLAKDTQEIDNSHQRWPTRITAPDCTEKQQYQATLQGSTGGAHDFSLETSYVRRFNSDSALHSVNLEQDFVDLMVDYYAHILEQGAALQLSLPGTPEERSFVGYETDSYGFYGLNLDAWDYTAAHLLTLHRSTSDREDIPGLRRWLQEPPAVTTPQEMLLQLIHPGMRLKQPQSIWMASGDVARSEALWKSEDTLDLVGNLVYLLRLRHEKKLGDELLLETLETLDVQSLMGVKDVVSEMAPYYLSGSEVMKLPLGTQKFRKYLRTLPLEDLLDLTVNSSISRGLAAGAAVDYAEKWLASKAVKPPTALEILQLVHDLGEHFESEYELSTYRLSSAINTLSTLVRTPMSYVCYQGWLETLQGRTFKNFDKIFVINEPKYWLRGSQHGAEATLTLLVDAVGAASAATIIHEVAHLGKPLSSSQWSTYAAEAGEGGDYHGMPASMWTKLV